MSAPLPSHAARLARLREEVRFRVLERAAIIAADTGMPWAEADELAYQQEAADQRPLPGVDK